MSTENTSKAVALDGIQVPREPRAYFDMSLLGTAKKSAEGYKVQLINPADGKPIKAPDGTPSAIWIVGPDCAQYRRAVDQNIRENDATTEAMTADERRAWLEDPQLSFERECRFLARLVSRAEGFGDAQGEVEAGDIDRLTAIFIDAPTIRDQIYATPAGGGSRIPFLPGSPQS